MRAIMVMFDSLNRQYLPPYGAEGIEAPNFSRLAERTATFENCYAGSMPCIPARRELHTGRYNFLHRGWGPLEPFDDSAPQLLSEHGVYTHLVTDHQHYWEDGGATYHNRYDSYEFFRGQEGDRWKGHVADPEMPEAVMSPTLRRPQYRQDWINRQYLQDELDHPQTLTFDAGLDFLRSNHAEDRWFLQLETFDPHEPFFSYERYHKLYDDPTYDGPHFDWPAYRQVIEPSDQADHARARYAALLSMCDQSLGRVLDLMDELDLWDDTMLLVGTDHGFLLGEHGWWGKITPPWYDETIHTPLFIWDPRSGVAGERRTSLVQTIDIAPSLLDLFEVPLPPDMQGRPLGEVIATDRPVREAGLFGAFGGHVSVTDGRHVYMRAPATADNQPLVEFTLMPTHMRSRFQPEELRDARLAEPFEFTKGVPTLRIDGWVASSAYAFGTLLFDLAEDPEQQQPLMDDELELRMATVLVDLMHANDAPPEQFERLGLPPEGVPTQEHLQVRVQWPQVVAAREPLQPADYPSGRWSVHTPIDELVQDAEARQVIQVHAPGVLAPGFLTAASGFSLVEIAAYAAGVIPVPVLARISDELVSCSEGPESGGRP